MTTETDIAILRQQVIELQRDAKESKAEIAKLKSLDENRMRSCLIGLVAVGGSLITYLWNLKLGGS